MTFLQEKHFNWLDENLCKPSLLNLKRRFLQHVQQKEGKHLEEEEEEEEEQEEEGE